MDGGRPGGNKAAAPEGNVKLPAPVGEGPGPPKYGGGYITEPGTPGGGPWPGRGISMAAATAASLKANSLRLSAIIAIISKFEPRLGSFPPSASIMLPYRDPGPLNGLRCEGRTGTKAELDGLVFDMMMMMLVKELANV